MQYMAFRLMKDGLSHGKRIALANLPEANENRKEQKKAAPPNLPKGRR